MNTHQDAVSILKEEYVKYYEDVPIQKYAAMYIGRDEDTIIRWKNDDQDFADAIQRAKAEWVRKKMLGVKAEFALERLEKSVFGKFFDEEQSQLPPAYIYFPADLPYDIVNREAPIRALPSVVSSPTPKTSI